MGMPVSYGCAVLLSPGMAGPPDSGTITVITSVSPTASGQPLATLGSMCLMINSVTGVPYMLPIGKPPSLVTASNQAIVRMGDTISSGPGMLTIIGPPAAAWVNDGTA
jgi:hypothetical protein